MLSLLISVLASIALVATLITTQVKTGTTIFFGIAGFIAAFILVGFLVRKKVEKVQNELQGIMLGGQQRMNRKVQQFQSKPNGNIKLIQRQIEADQKVVYKQALDFTQRLEPFKKWSFLMGRQIVTLRLQFLYQLKEFDQVDEIFAAKGIFTSPMMMEPMTVAMKMARQYKNKDVAGVEKTFKRRIKWFKSDRGTLLYGLMSWIFVKEGDPEKARQLLIKAKDATGNETFTRNWELLSNDKVKSFSNAGLGEEWYGLYLENPPTPKQQRMRGNAKGRRF
ncbi:MAG: hypothetical protein DRP64_14695 [Verrucomicrobia bacterium]|nr:MAG: hypothetical protein DRP64_14695 [Verrucomicrobiota bacterium]